MLSYVDFSNARLYRQLCVCRGLKENVSAWLTNIKKTKYFVKRLTELVLFLEKKKHKTVVLFSPEIYLHFVLISFHAYMSSCMISIIFVYITLAQMYSLFF